MRHGVLQCTKAFHSHAYDEETRSVGTVPFVRGRIAGPSRRPGTTPRPTKALHAVSDPAHRPGVV